MAKLIVQGGPARGAVYELSDAPATIGRDLGCDIPVPDARVSRRHARIAREGGRWVLTDLGSREGTLVNGKRVEQQPLASLDEIAVGEARLLFVADEARHELPPDDSQWVRPTLAETIVSDRIEILRRGRVAHSREQLEQATEGLISLFRFALASSEAATVEQLFERLSQAVEEAIAPDRVVPILLDPAAGERRPWLRQASAFDRELAKVPVSRSIIDFVFDERLSALSHAPPEDERVRSGASVQLNRISTAMCVPLRSGDELLGALYADRLGEGKPFTRTDLELLAALAMPTVAALRSIRGGEALQRERQALQREVRGRCRIVGPSPATQALLDFVERAALLDAPVLLVGERGTGRELAARAIHYSGPRAAGPFQAMHCAAPDEMLLEGELFGHARGAFEGAGEDRPGRLELACLGTLFLDGIDEMPLATQAKLLRAIDAGQFQRLGDPRDRGARARIIVATAADLEALAEAGSFRADLRVRLEALSCLLPPLRDRLEDIEPLCDHFLDLFCRECGKPRLRLAEDALAVLRRYPWPGNVRELRNLLERLVVLAAKPTIEAEDLPPELLKAPSARSVGALASLHDIERDHIQQVLRHTGGNKKEAAAILGIDRSTLYAKIKTHRLDL